MARFLMNVMLASGGYLDGHPPEGPQGHLAALDRASMM
jgi:hypothetical protein